MSLSIFPSHFYWQCVVGAHNRKQEIVSLWGNVRIRSLYAALSSWVRGDKSMTNVRVDGGEWSSGATQKGGGTRRGRVGREKKKCDGTCSFIHPFTPVATATCLEGTQERRHHWQKQQRGRELVRATDSKTRQTVCSNESWERGSRNQIYNWPRPLVPTQRGVNLTFRVSAKKCNDHSFIIGGHSD